LIAIDLRIIELAQNRAAQPPTASKGLVSAPPPMRAIDDRVQPS
jgi:hypothetical protein